MNFLKVVLGFIGGLIFLLALGWAFQGNAFFMYKYFAPKEEAVKREVFEQSKAYNQGVAQELNRAYQDYYKATTLSEKMAIASVARHLVADYDVSKLPPHLQSFVNEINKF